jgi:hypothetical protein
LEAYEYRHEKQENTYLISKTKLLDMKDVYYQLIVMKYRNIREEELKNKVGSDFFTDFDTTSIVGNIDFCLLPKQQGLF